VINDDGIAQEEDKPVEMELPGDSSTKKEDDEMKLE
jgi:hypothetical protein